MKTWIVLLKSFGYVWLTVAVVLILIGQAGVWMKGGFSAWQELMSPFNVVNWIMIVITLAPGGAALAWAKSLEQKRARAAGV